MNTSILRLEADMKISHVTAEAETATDRIAYLTGNTAPRVKEALENTPLRFSLVAPTTLKIRVAA